MGTSLPKGGNMLDLLYSLLPAAGLVAVVLIDDRRTRRRLRRLSHWLVAR
jgi:hypothetical protein